MWSTGSIAAIWSFLLCLAAGGGAAASTVTSKETVSTPNADDGPKLVCYYTPTRYFPASKVPSKPCTHLIYAFGSISGDGSGLTVPTAGLKVIWATLTDLRLRNPGLKVMLSLQQGFPNVVGPDVLKMKGFATNSVSFLRTYGFDGVDMDWEYPSISQKIAFAQFFTIMRAAIDKDAKTRGKPALLLSLALPNNQYVASRNYDLGTISGAVDFGTAMTYDFHVYNKADRQTGYNSPLNTPTGESKYLSTSAMAQYYLSQGFPGPKLLLGIPTYGRSWALASSASHGLHSPAVGKGAPGPYRHLTGIYTYPDACTAIKQEAQSIVDTQAGAVYLYKDTTWVAYDDVATVTAKVKWALSNGLGGVGVWAMHVDDVDGVCGKGPLPLIEAMSRTLLLEQTQTRPHPLRPIIPNAPLIAPQEQPASGVRFHSSQQNDNRVHFSSQNPIQFSDAGEKEGDSSLVLSKEWADLRGVFDNTIREDTHYGRMLQGRRISKSGLQHPGGSAGLALQRPGSRSDAVVLMENVDLQLEESEPATSQRQK